MLSPELAKAILQGEYNKLVYSDGKVIVCFINIHELACRCKIYFQDTYQFHTRYNYRGLCALHKWDEDNGWTYLFTFDADTEPEAIFIACEYILKELKK